MKKACIQYTIRGVSARTDSLLREAARQHGTSLNDEVLLALDAGLGVSAQPVAHHDLDDLIGTWVKDPAFDRTIREMDQVDKEMWK